VFENPKGGVMSNTQDVADKLVQFCLKGQYREAMEALYSPDILSVEAGAPPGQSRETKGIDGVRQKGDWWVQNHQVHSSKVEGPVVAGSHFAVAFKLDVTFKPQNKRFTLEEIGVYEVANGKIVREEFFYKM
jgi:ketosteroid isomerase-like protein